MNSARHRDLTKNVYLTRKSSYTVFKTASLVTYALNIKLAKNFVSVIPYNVVEKNQTNLLANPVHIYLVFQLIFQLSNAFKCQLCLKREKNMSPTQKL